MLSILFSSSISILITNDLNSLSGKLFICFIRVFSGFFLVLLFERNSLSFCLTFSVSMKLGEIVIYPSSEGVLCVGGSLHSLSLPCGFDGRAGSEVSMGHVFPWGLLAPTTLVGDRAEEEGLEPEPGMSQGFSWAH